MKLICINCKHIFEAEFLEEEKNYCPICHSVSEIIDEYTSEENKIAEEIVDQYIIEKMAYNITEYGNDRIWDIIETIFKNPLTRIKYRKYFLLAGGRVPEGK